MCIFAQFPKMMVKISSGFLVLLLLMAMGGVRAQGIRFEQGSFEEAKSKAMQEHKMLMLVVCADWLEVCEIMQNDIFTDAAIGAAYNGHFVAWRLDAKEIEGNPFFGGVRILSLPEFIFFDAAGKPQYREKKFKDHDEMLAMAQSARNPQNHLARMIEQYKSGNREAAFVQRYIVEMDAAGHDMREPSRAYLAKISREALLETQNWIIATIGVQQVTDGEFQYVLGNKAAFEKQFGEEPVREFILSAYRKSLADAVAQQNLRLLGSCQAVVRKVMGTEQAKPVILQDELAYHAGGTNWVAYTQSATNLFANYELDDAGLYNDVAWNLHEHVAQPDVLAKAELWALRSTQLEAAYWNLHTLAALQLKNKKPKEALETAKRAQGYTTPGSDEAKNVAALIAAIQK